MAEVTPKRLTTNLLQIRIFADLQKCATVETGTNRSSPAIYNVHCVLSMVHSRLGSGLRKVERAGLRRKKQFG
jgi:hypothetical protein